MDSWFSCGLGTQNSTARILIPFVEGYPEVLGDVKAGWGLVLPRVEGQDLTGLGVVFNLLLKVKIRLLRDF